MTTTLHHGEIRWTGSEDADTVELLTDLGRVSSSVHQSMPIVGPWFEERIRWELSKKLPLGWRISGPSQIFDRSVAGIRSRSWDLVVHHAAEEDLPPQASFNSGFPLLPKDLVAAVVDTKTMFNDVAAYASRNAFNLMNDCLQTELSFLGDNVRIVVLATSSNRRASTLWEQGRKRGFYVFSLSKMKVDPVSYGENRRWVQFPEKTSNNKWPLALFYKTILEAVDNHSMAQADSKVSE